MLECGEFDAWEDLDSSDEEEGDLEWRCDHDGRLLPLLFGLKGAVRGAAWLTSEEEGSGAARLRHEELEDALEWLWWP